MSRVLFRASQVALWVKNLATRQETHEFDPWIKKIPWNSALQPTPLFLPGESHGWKSLAGYSPWDHKELDMTEATEHTQVLFMLHFFSFVDL